MATIRERLVYAIDFVTDSAQKSIGGFRQQVSQAEGATNKFKAGASSALAGVGASAGLLAVAGGAAVATFAKKTIDAFSESAKAAIDLGAAIGVPVEDASRLIAVADDFEISAEQLTTGLGRIAKTLDDTKWAEYGIATRDASGQARDTNDILLDTFDTLGKIENQTERARVGNDLFGRGYANLAPLIGQTRKEYEDMLDAVSDAQVITAEEAETAEDYRLAQDKLNESLEAFTILIGTELAPAATQAVNDLASILEAIEGLKGGLEQIPGLGKILELGVGTGALRTKEAFEDMVDVFWTGGEAAESAASGVEELGDEVSTVGDAAESELPALEQGLSDVEKALRDGDPAWRAYLESIQGTSAEAQGAPGTFEDMERAVEGVNEAAKNAAEEGLAAFQQAITDAQDAITSKFDEFRDTLDMQDLLADIAEQVDRVNEAAEELGEGGEAEARNYRSEVRRLQGQVLTLLETYEDLPPSKITEIITRISQGDVNEILRVIDELTKDRFINVGVVVPNVHDAFHDINTVIGGGAPAPIFNNPNPAPTIGTAGGGGVTAQTFVTVNQLSSSPSSQYVDRQIDDRRNGIR